MLLYSNQSLIMKLGSHVRWQQKEVMVKTKFVRNVNFWVASTVFLNPSTTSSNWANPKHSNQLWMYIYSRFPKLGASVKLCNPNKMAYLHAITVPTACSLPTFTTHAHHSVLVTSEMGSRRKVLFIFTFSTFTAYIWWTDKGRKERTNEPTKAQPSSEAHPSNHTPLHLNSLLNSLV